MIPVFYITRALKSNISTTDYSHQRSYSRMRAAFVRAYTLAAVFRLTSPVTRRNEHLQTQAAHKIGHFAGFSALHIYHITISPIFADNNATFEERIAK